MILESVVNGPLIWPTIEENGLTRPRKYSELSPTNAIQVDCDVKETNIILQGLTVLVFKQGDDPIDVINHMISFLSVVVTFRYPTTNNQLRNSSNPRQQATINDGRVTLQPIQGRKISFATSTTRTYTPGASGSNSRKQRTLICYNCKGEGHMTKHYTKPKRKRDDAWFKDQVLLVQAQANGQILREEELAFLADPGITEDPSPSCIPTRFEVPKELPNVSTVYMSLKKLKHHLAGFDVVVKERTTATAITKGSWVFERTKACFRDEIIPFVKALEDIYNTFDQYLIDELTEVQNVFHQME
nr:hypothetical protein [Tanacetum cinerariifolium]